MWGQALRGQREKKRNIFSIIKIFLKDKSLFKVLLFTRKLFLILL